jgi:hypothetical protein
MTGFWMSISRNLLVTLWIYGVEIRHGKETGVGLEGDFSFDRD